MDKCCLVPSCKSPKGIPFPSDPEEKEKWLKILEIRDVPNAESFVCSAHLNKIYPGKICVYKMFVFFNLTKFRKCLC